MSRSITAFAVLPHAGYRSPAPSRARSPVAAAVPAAARRAGHVILDAAAFLVLCLWTASSPAAVRQGLDGPWDATFATE